MTRTPGRGFRAAAIDSESTAYLQYTSGSTRQPAGVMISHRNLVANFRQITSDYFLEYGKFAPPDTTTVSWLPYYHDLGLILGICAPILAGVHGVSISPIAFLQRPARWMQLLAGNGRVFSSAPNFAFDLAARKTSDDDMAGLDLGDVLIIQNGAERVQPATLRRFTERFARFGLRDNVIRPSYGLAEATVYVATRTPAQPPEVVGFDADQLSAGHAQRSGGGTALVSYGVPQSPTVRIVDPDTSTECPEATVGEIWVHGDNVAAGYWGKPEETERTFGGVLVDRSPDTPVGPWLRTGDLGFISDGELFIVGRIKDLLIVHGRNHSPDDIEMTIQEITGGRVAAISVRGGPHGETGRRHRTEEARRLPRRGGGEDAHASGRRSRRRYSMRTASASAIWCSWHRVRYRSPPAARSGARRASSCTGRANSTGWTGNLTPPLWLAGKPFPAQQLHLGQLQRRQLTHHLAQQQVGQLRVAGQARTVHVRRDHAALNGAVNAVTGAVACALDHRAQRRRARGREPFRRDGFRSR